MLKKENRGTHAENLALHELQRPSLLVHPAEGERVFWTCMEVLGSFEDPITSLLFADMF